jgi:tetratricopeptide (TPR) repeat protein
MYHYFILILFALSLSAQEVPLTEPTRPESTTQYVQPQLREQSFFTDRIATARVDFDTIVEAPEDWSKVSDGFRIIDIEVLPNSENNTKKPTSSSARIRFLPTRVGVLTLPPFDFQTEDTHYQTTPVQILVSEPQQSEQMSLELKPNKLQVYVGEPLRIDLTWHCLINAATLKHLKLFPDFFNNDDIQIVIPRNTAPEAQQVGLPIGGRRVIATRTPLKENEKALGTLELPLYLRFNAPGSYILPATHLECALLDKPNQGFARYAAHFNNSFFVSVDPSEGYRRIYTEAPAIEIEVLPLPVDPTHQPFTGLFAPISIDISAQPTELEIGQLMELELKINSDAPHGMLELPPLSQQAGLRERFIVDDNYGSLWQENGSIFRTRLRPLATSTQAIPTLHFRIFNSQSHQYEDLQTEPIKLNLQPSQGREFIPLNTFKDASISLSQQETGIWNNLEKNPMNDTAHLIAQVLIKLFWPLLSLGPILFLLLLPTVRERRRRALNPDYARRMAAYQAFKKIAADSPQKWPAFLQLMATTFGSQAKAWTRGDSQQALKKIGIDTETTQAILDMHDTADAATFSQHNQSITFKNLNQIAQKVIKNASKVMLLLIGIHLLILPPKSMANEWDEAEQSFQEALNTPLGSESATAAYKIAALKFQNLASTHKHAGEAWINAGNAWFQAGELGRAIAAYRSAQKQRPFDAQLAQSLAAARAATLNSVADQRTWLQQIPITWLKITLLGINTAFWISLLFTLRYRQKRTHIVTVSIGACLVILACYLSIRQSTKQAEGSIIVDTIYAKKGPSYAYANAFNEALYDGLECTIIETRAGWHHIQLKDTRHCWVPQSSIQIIK